MRSLYADVEKTIDPGKLRTSIQTRLDSWIFLVENFQTNDAAKGNDLQSRKNQQKGKYDKSITLWLRLHHFFISWFKID